MLQFSFHKFLKQSEILLGEFKLAEELPSSLKVNLQDHCQQMVVVRLQDSWATFIKSLILNSASGRAETLSGDKVSSSHAFRSYSEAYTWVMSEHRGSGEPDWHVADNSLRWCRLLCLSNTREIANALGAANSPEKLIRDYRNFIVHRCNHTSNRLKDTLRNQNIRHETLQNLPNEFITGGVPRFENWVRRLQLIAKLASN